MHKENRISILNNVLGPIGVGPSTSNTCGPCRIAFLCRKMLRGALASARITFPTTGGFATPNFYGMRSDYAFAHGLLGRLPDDPAPLLGAFEDLKAAGIALTFGLDAQIADAGDHLLCKLELFGRDGDHVLVKGVSKGGGVIEIIEINAHPVSIGGDTYTTLIILDQTRETSSNQTISAIKEICGEAQDRRYQESSLGEEKLIVIESKEAFSEQDLQRLEEQAAITKVCLLPPVFPVVMGAQTEVPFANADALSAYCSNKGVSLFEAAVAYEQAVSGWSGENILQFAKDILSVMRRSIREGLSGAHTFQGIARPVAANLFRSANARENGVSVVLQASIYALAIMEYSNFSGVVVCAPTAGASGVLAGTLVALGEAEDADEDRMVESLLAAGAIGAAISAENDFCGGVYGCQAEVGCASCMAAAAAVHMLGGTVKQAMDAASMALQNMLGLICDPVCGLVQVPCFSRNIGGVSNAITCAQMCMLGYDPVISLQSAFEAMKTSGEALPAELKGCGGGLCATACGKKLTEAYYDGAATL